MAIRLVRRICRRLSFARCRSTPCYSCHVLEKNDCRSSRFEGFAITEIRALRDEGGCRSRWWSLWSSSIQVQFFQSRQNVRRTPRLRAPEPADLRHYRPHFPSTSLTQPKSLSHQSVSPGDSRELLLSL